MCGRDTRIDQVLCDVITTELLGNGIASSFEYVCASECTSARFPVAFVAVTCQA